MRQAYSDGNRKILFWLATGGGKCQDGETPILMFDGSIKKAKDIKKGDALMGIDSRPRNVVSVCHGYDEMFKVIPVKGDSHVFNESHILTLISSYTKYGYQAGELINISIKEYMNKNKTFKHQFKWTRVGVDFSDKKTEFDPYFVGLYLAEGSKHSNMITNPDEEIINYLKKEFLAYSQVGDNIHWNIPVKEKGRKLSSLSALRREITTDDQRKIPDIYKINSRKNRLKLLAGLLDGDGYYHHGHYEIITKYSQLNSDILFLARSLGYAAYSKTKIGKIKSINFEGNYYRITISGDFSELPIKIGRKKPLERKQVKSVLNTGFKIESVGKGKYYGFQLDGDHRYLLGDFSVTHNSLIFLHTIYNLLSKNKKVIFVVRRRQLVIQAYEHFKKNGIESSIIMGSDKRFDKNKSLQICSIDTITRRDYSFMINYDACVIDESHDCTSPKYKSFLDSLNCGMFIGLTATPFAVGKKVHDFWDCCVKPIEVDELRDRGFLTNAKILVAQEVDLSGIKKVAGDYSSDELAKKMSELKVIGDVIDGYKRFGNNKTAILFAVNKDHSITMAQAFVNSGIEAIHCDESSTQKERDDGIKRLKECARIKKPFVLCNVNIFSTGVDIPEAEVGIMARPTQSEILYIQQVGRLLRPFKLCARCFSTHDNSESCYVCGSKDFSYTKEMAIIIDNGGNVTRHKSPFKKRVAILREEDKKKKEEQDKKDFKTKTCSKCFATYEANKRLCPFCEHENDKVQREIKTADGELVPYDEFLTMKNDLDRFTYIRDSKQYKKYYPYFKLYEIHGDDVYKYPQLKVPKFVKKHNENKINTYD
jgi:superfamily II DNA or RNA helicase